MSGSVARIFGPLVLAFFINACAAALNAGTRARRAMGVCLGLSCMAPAWLVPEEHTLIRSLWVMGTFMGAARTVDLARGRWSLGARLVHAFSLVDTRRLVKVSRALETSWLGLFVAWEAVAWGAYEAIPLASRFTGAAYLAWRWGSAVLFFYALTAGAYPLFRLGYRLAGFATPPLHIEPALSRSVQEFWGERWNRIVSTWLGETFFRPLARRRHPALGGFAAFFASALLHAYIVLVAASLGEALVMLAYFVTQAAVIGLERVLGTRRWAPWLGRVWTITWMLATAPLFAEPALRVFGV